MKKIKSERVDNSLKLIVKSSFVVFAFIILSKILTFVYRILVARYYGAETYGIITLTLVVVGIVVTLASLGIPQGVMRFVPGYRGEGEQKKIKYILQVSSKILIITSLSASVILFIFSDYLAVKIFESEELGMFLRIFSMLVPLWVLSNFFMTTLTALEKIGVSSFLNNVVLNAIKTTILVVLILWGIGQEAVVYSYYIGYVFLFASSFFIFRRYVSVYFKKKIRKKEYKEVFRNFYSYSWPLVLVGIIWQVFYWADSLTIGYFLGVENVGVYNVAVPLVLFFSLAPEIFSKLFFPLINRMRGEKNFGEAKQISQQIAKWIFMINFPLLILVLFFPEQIISAMFGNDFVVAKNALRILAVGSFVFAQAQPSRLLILASGKSKIILKTVIITAIIDILLNIILIPRIGIIGAALSTMTMNLLLAGIFIFKAGHLTEAVPLKRRMFRVILASMLLVAGLEIARSFFTLSFVSVIISGLVFVGAYVLLILFTGCLDKKDKMILRTIQKNILKRMKIKSSHC